MFEERSPYSSIRCFRCRFNGTLGTTPHLHDKVHDTLVCVSCGSVMEEEREVLSGVISSWFDATWSEGCRLIPSGRTSASTLVRATAVLLMPFERR